MAEVVTDYPNCTGCCSAVCPNGYLRDIFGTSGICPDAAIAAKPVILLCELTFDKANASWEAPGIAACFPDSLKVKMQSSGSLTIGNQTCATNVTLCSPTAAGFNPAWPNVSMETQVLYGHSAHFWYLGSGRLGSTIIVTVVFDCNGTTYRFNSSTSGGTSIVSHNCSPFEMNFNYGFNSSGFASYITATAKWTLASDCSSPYKLSGIVTTGGDPVPDPVAHTFRDFNPLASPVVSQATTPCKHLGANIQDPATCNCGTAILRHCSVYGACRVTGTSTAGEGICLTCPDYQAP